MLLKKLTLDIKKDLYRYKGNLDATSFIYALIMIPGFKYIFIKRICNYSKTNPLLRFGVYHFFRILLEHYKYKFGYDIPYDTSISGGFYIGHFGGIVINNKAIIGENVNISQGVTIGQINRGSKAGVPVVGNNVYIGPGAKIIGNIKIGNHAAIGANAVVTKDVPDYGVVVGIPGTVISMSGSNGYIQNLMDEK